MHPTPKVCSSSTFLGVSQREGHPKRGLHLCFSKTSFCEVILRHARMFWGGGCIFSPEDNQGFCFGGRDWAEVPNFDYIRLPLVSGRGQIERRSQTLTTLTIYGSLLSRTPRLLPSSGVSCARGRGRGQRLSGGPKLLTFQGSLLFQPSLSPGLPNSGALARRGAQGRAEAGGRD